MRKISTLIATALLAVCVGTRAFGADLEVIANVGVGAPEVSADELQGGFLVAKAALSDGSHVEAALQKTRPVHEAFVKEYLGKTGVVLQTYYRSLVFTGKAYMPTMLGTDAQIVAYGAKTKGAIRCVSAGASTAGVKTLEVKQLGPTAGALQSVEGVLDHGFYGAPNPNVLKPTMDMLVARIGFHI